jgi:hypothetical protein
MKPGDMYNKMKAGKLKKTGKTGGKSNKLGGGGRFKQVVNKVKGEKGVKKS